MYLYFSGIAEIGYATGVAYINSCTPNEIKNLKSLYFVVRDDIIIPIAKARRAIWITIKGISKIFDVMLILFSLLKP
jgi:hypothetical protein